MSARDRFRTGSKPKEELMENQFEIKTENCGFLNVYVQGDVNNILPTTPVFLTVHDIGTNHHEYHELIEHPCMTKLKSRSVWIHVDLPGQEYDSIDLPPYFEFPSFDLICQDLVEVMDYFRIKYCITLGEGAGANILLRFAMTYPERILGNVLIHCVTSVASMTKYFQEKIMSWKLNTIGMNATADQYLVYHKFGMYLDSRKDLDTEKTIKDFLEKLHKRINPKNLRLYVNAYLNRSDLTNMIREKLKVDTMIACGSYPHLMHMADEMQAQMDPKITTRVNVEHCSSILNEAPEIFAYNLLLFCQGLGLFSALPISRHGSISY